MPTTHITYNANGSGILYSGKIYPCVDNERWLFSRTEDTTSCACLSTMTIYNDILHRIGSMENFTSMDITVYVGYAGTNAYDSCSGISPGPYGDVTCKVGFGNNKDTLDLLFTKYVSSTSIVSYTSSSITIQQLLNRSYLYIVDISDTLLYNILRFQKIEVNVTYRQNREHHEYIKNSSSSSYTEITTPSITVPKPSYYDVRFADNWGDRYTRYIHYRVNGGDWRLIGQLYQQLSDLTAQINIQNPNDTYEVQFSHTGGVIDRTTTITLLPSTKVTKYRFDNVDYNVNDGQTYSIAKGSSTNHNVVFTYTDSWADTCEILVNGSIVAQGSSSVSYTYPFTVNGSYEVTYRSNLSNPITFTLLVSGIITGTGKIYINEHKIDSSYSPNVAQYFEYGLHVEGLIGEDEGNTTYVWTINGTSGTDYILSYDPTDTAHRYPIIKLCSIGYQYKPVCKVYSYGTLVHTINTGTGYVTCSGQTVATNLLLVPHEGDTTTVFKCSGMTIKPTISSYDPVTPRWSLWNGDRQLVEDTEYTVTKYSYDDTTGVSEFWITLNIWGNFIVKLEAIESGYDTGSTTDTFNVANVTVVEQPVYNRICIVVYNDTYTSVLHRGDKDTLYQALTFSSGLNSIGSAEFQVVGENNLPSGLINIGSKVVIVDNMCPIWSGIITSFEPMNLNFYNSTIPLSILNVKCEESLKELSYSYTSPDIVSGTLHDIISALIPSEHLDTDSISPSSIIYAMSYDVSSRLSAMDSIVNQIGWKYRCRQSVPIFDSTLTITSGVYRTILNEDIDVGDIIILYDNEDENLEGWYSAGKVSGYGSNKVINFSSKDRVLEDGTYHFSVFRNYIIDFKPSYYQDYVPTSLKINDLAQNVNNTSSSKDKFSEVSVYGVGNSGETISSTMKAWMDINKDYTIPYSARISKSYDSTIDSVTMNEQSSESTVKFTITLNGWSYPNTSIAQSPHIFYRNNTGVIRSITLNPSSVTRYKDQTGMLKTALSCSVSTTDTDEDGRLISDIIASLSPLTNVIFNVLYLESNHVLTSILPQNDVIRIGDMKATSTSVSDSTGVLTFNWDTNTMPHGHLTDILVMDESGSKYPNGYTYNNPSPNSPATKYKDVKITIQGAEGYSAMELEKLACRYMQYGSNYDSRGSASVVYLADKDGDGFIKSDYKIGCKRIPIVGDRIQFEKATDEEGVWEVSNYELISYKVDLSKYTVELNFGMPFVEIGDILYNMLSNSGMSMLPANT